MDGIIGNMALAAINASETKTLFVIIHRARVKYYRTIAKKGKIHLFLGGGAEMVWQDKI